MSPTLQELRELLPVACIDLHAEANNREDAVRQSGQLLVDAGYVEPHYIDEMLDREHAVSTFVGQGIAMPHGTLTAKEGVLKEGLSLLLFQEPIDWNGEPVTIVMGIAAHGRRYIALLSQLATVLLDEGRVGTLSEASTEEQVYALLAQ